MRRSRAAARSPRSRASSPSPTAARGLPSAPSWRATAWDSANSCRGPVGVAEQQGDVPGAGEGVLDGVGRADVADAGERAVVHGQRLLQPAGAVQGHAEVELDGRHTPLVAQRAEGQQRPVSRPRWPRPGRRCRRAVPAGRSPPAPRTRRRRPGRTPARPRPGRAKAVVGIVGCRWPRRRAGCPTARRGTGRRARRTARGSARRRRRSRGWGARCTRRGGPRRPAPAAPAPAPPVSRRVRRRAWRRPAGRRPGGSRSTSTSPAAATSRSPASGSSVRVRGAPGQRGVDVVALGGQPRQPPGLPVAAQLRLGPLGQGGEVADVRPGDPVGLAGLGQPLGGVLPDRLQQVVPRPAVPVASGAVDDDQRPVDQPAEQVHDRRRVQRLAAGDGLHGLQRPAAAEHRQPPQQHPLRVGEQLVAPVDGGPQRALPRLRGARTGGQQREAVAHPARRARRPAAPPRGRRPARWPAASRRGAGRSRRRPRRPPGRGRRSRAARRGPGRGRAATAALPVSSAGVGGRRRDGQRVDGVLDLAAGGQRLAAGGQQPHVGAGLQQPLGEQRAGVGEVLAVVQHQQHARGRAGDRAAGPRRSPWPRPGSPARPARPRTPDRDR